jgi:WD40 repeat protein
MIEGIKGGDPMKIRRYLIIVLTLTLLSACQSVGTQPVFSTSAYDAATPIPFSNAKPKIVATLSGRIRSFSVNPDGKTIAFATSQGVVLYDLKSYKRLQTLSEAESVYLVDWSPDGTKLAAGGLIMGNSEFGKSHLVVWETSNWKIMFEQKSEEDLWDSMYGDIAWSPDSRSLASSINGMGVLVYDIQTGKVISRQETLAAHSISWSPDGTRLVATGDLANGIRRWKVSTGETVRLFDQQVGSSMQIAWSPDGKRIVSGGAEGTVCFWTAATNKCDGFIIKAHRNSVFSLDWSSDGGQLATGGGIIRIWDSNTGQLVKSFGMNDISIYTHLEWLGSNQPLVSIEVGYADTALSIVRFWDVDTGKLLFEFDGASGSWGE